MSQSIKQINKQDAAPPKNIRRIIGPKCLKMGAPRQSIKKCMCTFAQTLHISNVAVKSNNQLAQIYNFTFETNIARLPNIKYWMLECETVFKTMKFHLGSLCLKRKQHLLDNRGKN